MTQPNEASALSRRRRLCGDFWRGLTTPSPGTLLGALALLVLALAGGSFLAREDRVVKGSAADWLDPVADPFARASVIAMQGAARHAPGPEPALVFVGASSLRFWLPHPDEAARVVGEALGGPRRVLTLCGNSQGLAASAALIERFGFDFDGWIVIGVDRQALGRSMPTRSGEARRNQARTLGFDSERFLAESVATGYPQRWQTGWSLWDHRAFHYQTLLGFRRWLPGGLATPYDPHATLYRVVNLEQGRKLFAPLDPDILEAHLGVLERIVADAWRAGRARVAVLEAPWLDRYEPALRVGDWMADEAAYRARRERWAKAQGVPWLDPSLDYPISLKEFFDVRHFGAEAFRRRFVADTARQLAAEEAR